MSEQSDPRQLLWGGLPLGIALNLIKPGTTKDDVKRDRKKHNQLKKTYDVLNDIGVGKVNGQFVDTEDGVREKLAKAASDNAAAIAQARAKKAANNNNKG
jgi:hypothetical protein